MKLSIIIPIFNEEHNICLLYDEINRVMDKENFEYEVIFVDDGSTDNSLKKINDKSKHADNIKCIKFSENCGQTQAIQAGIDYAKGEYLILLDGDGQNDPIDIPEILDGLCNGYDSVIGWRKNRHDNYLKKFPSFVANWIIQKIFNIEFHDMGCTLKGYKKEVLTGQRLFGNMHRLLPIYFNLQNCKTKEIIVNHRPRTTGISKYGLGRVYRVIFDIIFLVFVVKFNKKPKYFFGFVGALFFIFSLLSLVLHAFSLNLNFLVFAKYSYDFVIVFFVLSVIIFLQGICFEFLLRKILSILSITNYNVDKIIQSGD